MRRFMFVTGILWIMIAAVPSPGDDRFTLEQAVATALKSNPRVLSALKEAEASLGRKLQLEAIPDPEVLFSDEGLGLGHRSKIAGEKEISFGIQQSLEFPGKRALRSRVGKYGERIALLEVERAKLVVGAEAKRAYYKTVMSSKTISSLEGTLALLDRFIETAAARYQVGAVPLPRRPPGPGRESAGPERAAGGAERAQEQKGKAQSFIEKFERIYSPFVLLSLTTEA